MRPLLVTCVATLALLATGCAKDAPAPTVSAGHGKEFPAKSTPHIAIKKGERFSVVVSENASIGDQWQLREPPDAKIAATEKEDYVSDSAGTNPPPGSGGKRFFVFTATAAGESAIGVYDCFRGCQTAEDKKQSTAYEIHLTVTN